MVIAAKKLTYADVERIPQDGFRHEIIGGEEFMTPAPDLDHQTVVGNLFRILAIHARANSLGRVFVAPTDVLLTQHDVVEPDVVFVAQASVSILKEKYIQGPPELVVEVLSPSTASQDRGEKLDLYGRCGVREYWIADLSSRTVEVREFGSPRRTRVYQQGQSFESALLPGPAVALDEVFSV